MRVSTSTRSSTNRLRHLVGHSFSQKSRIEPTDRSSIDSMPHHRSSICASTALPFQRRAENGESVGCRSCAGAAMRTTARVREHEATCRCGLMVGRAWPAQSDDRGPPLTPEKPLSAAGALSLGDASDSKGADEALASGQGASLPPRARTSPGPAPARRVPPG